MESQTAKKKTFRLATINVQEFETGSTFENNVNDLVTILNPLNLDLIAVQEVVNDESWINFRELLSLPYNALNSTEEECFGNGFASRYPIISSSSERANFSCLGGKRSLLQCRLDGDHSFIQDRVFAVTHLDHLDEDDRLTQIKESEAHQQNIDILMGDMNALTREDYSDDYYQHIVVEKREKSLWEKPRFDLTKLITDEWSYQDAFKLINPQLKDEEVVTCCYGTRIDYIYVHPRVNDQWTLTNCQIIDTKGATGHNAVFAEFELKSM